MRSMRVIIWGHKSASHTHHHIHYGYFKAFKALGYDVYWFDKRSDISNFSFENALFSTEDQAHEGIPLLRRAKYVLHHCTLNKYIDARCSFINLRNYLKTYELDYANHAGSLQIINKYTYYDTENHLLIQPWATDLLPHEFSPELLTLDASSAYVNYVGTVWGDNSNLITRFNDACDKRGKIFKNSPSESTGDQENQHQ